jgi:hypothetical protein
MAPSTSLGVIQSSIKKTVLESMMLKHQKNTTTLRCSTRQHFTDDKQKTNLFVVTWPMIFGLGGWSKFHCKFQTLQLSKLIFLNFKNGCKKELPT